jgi:hypothetical protein
MSPQNYTLRLYMIPMEKGASHHRAKVEGDRKAARSVKML